LVRKQYALEERTFRFAQDVRLFGRRIEKSVMSRADLYQLAESSGSIGANYLEANNALSRKDFVMRIRICLKEAKESGYWLRLLGVRPQEDSEDCERMRLLQESTELVKIFSTIIKNCQKVKS
jgi:four helix bundle protein